MAVTERAAARAGTPSPTVAEARQRYFEQAGLGDGGYDARWVKLKAGPLRIVFPNRPGRVRAVRLHDLHHVATGYDTSWRGEAQISAWEIGGGCGRHWWAWHLNLGAFAIGLAICPRACLHAFARGRRSRTLYRTVREFREELLSWSVEELRAHLRLEAPAPPPTARDGLAFAAWSLAALAYNALPLAAFALAAIALG